MFLEQSIVARLKVSFKLDAHCEGKSALQNPCLTSFISGEVNWLFNVKINDISVIYVTAHRCAGRLKTEVGPTVGLPTP